ncbi:MAG: hypothetical protein SA339_05825 [Methanomassiliicoccus sp.]|nr:hypothetical protein [Methanomassiliicoccus sp.]
MTCPRCGANKRPELKFCSFCGLDLDAPVRPLLPSRPVPIMPSEEEPAYRKRLRIMVTFAAMAVAVVLIIASLAMV